MMKRIFMAVTFLASFAVTDIKANTLACYSTNVYMYSAPNDGSYTKTSYSVSIYTEDGHYKGLYAIYLHHGKRYIDFNNTWICIQGKSRFGYCGNWYVIK